MNILLVNCKKCGSTAKLELTRHEIVCYEDSQHRVICTNEQCDNKTPTYSSIRIVEHFWNIKNSKEIPDNIIIPYSIINKIMNRVEYTHHQLEYMKWFKIKINEHLKKCIDFLTIYDIRVDNDDMVELHLHMTDEKFEEIIK